MKIKKGDTVKILAGKDKGKTGKVLAAMPKTNLVLVEGMNMIKRHQKARRLKSQGQIIERGAPIHASNVAVVEGGKAVRVGYKITGTGKDRKKERIARQTGKTI